MITGKPGNNIKLVTSSTQTPSKQSELTTAELSSYEAWIVLASENNNLTIRSSNPDHTLSDLYCCISLILRQIEQIIMDDNG